MRVFLPTDLETMRKRGFPVVVFSILAQTATVRLSCSDTLGAPRLDDCHNLLQTFPMGSAPQLFDEEQ